MADLGFNIKDVQSLAQKLSMVQGLTHQEYVLLLAIFAAAAARAESTNEETGAATLPMPEVSGHVTGTLAQGYATAADLQQQLLDAYIPGNYFDDLTTRAAKTVGLRNRSAQLGNLPADEGGKPVT